MLAMVLIIALIAVYPAIAFPKDHSQVQTGETKTVSIEDVENDTTSGGAIEGIGIGTQKPWKIARNEIMQERKVSQMEFSEVGKQIEEYESQIKDAEAMGNNDEVERLKTLIEQLKIDKDDYKAQIILKIEALRELTRGRYTVEELSQLEKVGQSLSELFDVEALPVENILLESEDVKFDTPPVIKQGRTLIPVRAISESMGATVAYDSVLQTVTIVKGDKTVILDLADDTVTVNDLAVATEVPAEIMNNRTMVPLRFIAENLGLKVQWEQETMTVEISE